MRLKTIPAVQKRTLRQFLKKVAVFEFYPESRLGLKYCKFCHSTQTFIEIHRRDCLYQALKRMAS